MRSHIYFVFLLFAATSAFAQTQAFLNNPSSSDQPLPDQLWSTEIGITTFRTNMAFVDGKLYIGSNGDKRTPGDDAMDGVHEIDGKTGQLLNTYANLDGYSDSEDKDVCGVYADEKRVVFGNDGGDFFCYDRKSAEIVWKYQAGGAFEGVPAAADLNNDRTPDFVVAVKTIGEEQRGNVLAINGKDGEILWAFTASSKGEFMGSPALTDLNGDGVKDAIIGSGNVGGSHPKYNPEGGGHLYAIDGKTGRALWKYDTYSGIHSSPMVITSDDNEKLIVFTESYSEVHFLDHNGYVKIKGEFDIPDGGIMGLFASPLVSMDKRLILSSSWWGKDDVTFTCKLENDALDFRELDDGAKVMVISNSDARKFVPTHARVSATPLYFESDKGKGYFIFGSEDGKIYSIDTKTGDYIQREGPGPIEAPLFLSDVNNDGEIELLVASTMGKLYAYKSGLKSDGKRSLLHWPSFRGNRNNTGEASYTVDF